MSINKAFVLKKKKGDCDKTQVQVMMRNNTYIPNRKLVEAFRNKYFIVIQQK